MLPFTQGDSWPQPPPMAKKYSSRWFLRTFTLSKWFILSTVLLHVCMCAQTLSRVQLFLHVTPLSMGSSHQEHRSGLLFPPPGNLPSPWVKPISFTSPTLAGECFFLIPLVPPGKWLYILMQVSKKLGWIFK